jgi:hypothetical protein
MPRNGAVNLNDLVVQRVLHVKNGTSVLVAQKGQFTVTIEKTGQFPDDMHVRPDGTLDLRLEYDPK